MTTEDLDKNPDFENQPDLSSEKSEDGSLEHSGKRKKRIKIRKRIRIKKKPSAKKQVKKVAERIFWTIIIIGFITSLIVMIVQLDIKDEKFKQKRRSPSGKTSY